MAQDQRSPAVTTNGWLVGGNGDDTLLELHKYLCLEYGSDLETGMPILDVTILPIEYFQEHDSVLNGILSRLIDREQISETIRIVWTSNKYFNACALQFSGAYFIIIHAGCIPVLNSLFSRLMASPTFLPKLGNTSLEKVQPKIKIRRDLTSVFSLGEELVQPNCPTRRLFASILLSEAFKFLLFHEYSHIVHGHVSPGDPVTEINGYEDLAANLKSHVLEMDADAGAIGRTFKELTMVFGRLELPQNHPDPDLPALRNIKSVFPNGELPCLTILSIVLSAFFTVFRADKISVENMYHGSHPQAAVRLLMAFATLGRHIQKNSGGMVKAHIESASMEGLRAVYEEIALTEGASEVLRSGLDFAIDGNMDIYVSSLKDYWARYLFPTLNKRKLTKNPLAPPE